MRLLDRVLAAAIRLLDRALRRAVTPIYPSSKIFDEPPTRRWRDPRC